jgi:hypothetical protein
VASAAQCTAPRGRKKQAEQDEKAADSQAPAEAHAKDKREGLLFLHFLVG